MELITLISNIVLASLLIGMIFTYQARKPIKQVEQLRPRDRRFEIMTVNNETDLSLHCKKKGGAFWRFIKRGTAWVGNMGGRSVTKFFGIEGRAWTTIFEAPNTIEVSVPEFLIDCWGEKFYNYIPAKQRRKLEGKVGITVEPVEQFPDIDSDINAEQIDEEDEKNVLGHLAESVKATTIKDLYKAALPFLLGAMTMYFFIKQGYLP